MRTPETRILHVTDSARLAVIPALLVLLASSTGCDEDHPPLQENETATLPVIFHIIHHGEAVGSVDNVPAYIIQNSLDKLNQNFRNDPQSEDVGLQFRLATIDPDGDPLDEPGIHRVYSPGYGAISEMDLYNTTLLQQFWNPRDYINVWIADTYSPSWGANNISWATFPVMTYEHPLNGLSSIYENSAGNFYPSYTDGIVLSNEMLVQDANGNILAHEMGHYFGLYHVFDENCLGDYLTDTYHYNRDNYDPFGTNNLLRFTCQGNWVSGDNYMDYFMQNTYRFTSGQRQRMRYAASYSPLRSPARFSDKHNDPASMDTLGIFPEPRVESCHLPQKLTNNRITK